MTQKLSLTPVQAAKAFNLAVRLSWANCSIREAQEEIDAVTSEALEMSIPLDFIEAMPMPIDSYGPEEF